MISTEKTKIFEIFQWKNADVPKLDGNFIFFCFQCYPNKIRLKLALLIKEIISIEVSRGPISLPTGLVGLNARV